MILRINIGYNGKNRLQVSLTKNTKEKSLILGVLLFSGSFFQVHCGGLESFSDFECFFQLVFGLFDLCDFAEFFLDNTI